MTVDYRIRIPNVVIPDFSEGLNGISESLRHLGEQKRQRLKDLEYKRQNDLVERRAAEAHRQATRKFERENADRNVATTGDIVKEYNEGGLTAARARAATAQYVDPVTGEMRGIGFEEEVPELKMPAAPQLRNPTAEPAGRTPGAGLRALLGGGMQLRPPGAPGASERDANAPGRGLAGLYGRRPDPELTLRTPDTKDAELQLATGRARDELEQAREQRRAGTRGAIVIPGGAGRPEQRIVLDPDERDRFQQRRSAEQADRLVEAASAPGTPPELASRYLAEAERLRARVPGASAQHLRNVETMEDKQDFETEMREKYDLTAAKKFDIAMHKGRGRGAGDGTGRNLKKERDELELLRKLGVRNTQVSNEVGKLLEKQGYKELRGEHQVVEKLSEMSKLAVSNSAAAAFLRGWVARYGQGAGVLTESDLNVFYNNIGSIAERYGIKASEVLTGTPTEDKVKLINEALDATARVAMNRRMSLGQNIVDTMLAQREVYRNDEEWKLHTATYLRNYAPPYMSVFEKEFGEANPRLFMGTGGTGVGPQKPIGAPAAGGSAAAGPGGPPPPPPAGADPRILEWARANAATDPDAKAYLAKFGGK